MTGASSPSLSSLTQCRQREMDVGGAQWTDGRTDDRRTDGGDRHRGSIIEQGTTCPCVLSGHLPTSALFAFLVSTQSEVGGRGG